MGILCSQSTLRGLTRASLPRACTHLQALLASFEAYNDISGFARAPQYHLLRGAYIDPSVRRAEPTRQQHQVESSASAPRAAAPARDARSRAPGCLVVSDDMFARVRSVGVRQLLVMGGLALDLGCVERGDAADVF